LVDRTARLVPHCSAGIAEGLGHPR